MKFWYTPKTSWQAQCLRPCSWLYRLVIRVRRYAYSKGWLASYRASVPVVVVGNITVGGTGKTPLLIAMARWLLSHQVKVGIMSRGYGGAESNTPQIVSKQSTAQQVGDEALLIAEATSCPVVVCAQRKGAAQLLLEQFNCDCILSDDGLQHYAIARDLEINLIDQQRAYGNGLCLPAGPLREPQRRAEEVDITVLHVKPGSELADAPPNFHMYLRSGLIYQLQQPEQHFDLRANQQRKIHAVAGIGHPARFFNQLQALGLEVVPHAFADHHAYSAADFAFAKPGEPIIMTEKDAVKCRQLGLENAWVLPVYAELSELFWQSIGDHLSALGDVYRPPVAALVKLRYSRREIV